MKLLSHFQNKTPRCFAPVAFVFALMAVFVCLPQNAPATEYVWSGLGANTRPNTAANWVGGSAPTMTGTLTFNGSGTNTRKGEPETLAFNSSVAAFFSSTGLASIQLTASQTTGVNFTSDSTFLANSNYMRFFGVASGTTTNIKLEAGSGSFTIDGDHNDNVPFRIVMVYTISGASYHQFLNENPSGGSKIVLGEDVIFTLGGGQSRHTIFDGTGDIDLNGRFLIGTSSNIIKRGTGVLTMAGDNMDNVNNIYNLSSSSQFNAGFILEEGRLNLNNAGALGSGNFRINGNATIDNTSGTAIVSKYNQPTTLNRDFTFIGTHELNLGTGQVTLAGPQRTITVSAGRLEFSGAINGAGVGITQDGAGTLVLSGNSTAYNGTITVENGAVMANGSIAQSSVTVADGAAFGGSGTAVFVTVNEGGVLRPGDLTLIVTDAAAMESGTFTGTIGAGHSTLTIDKSVSDAGEIVQLASGAEMEFALGKGHTNTQVLIASSAAAATPSVAFNDTAIKLQDLAGGEAALGEYVLFATNGTFDTDFSGLTLDADGYITAGLSVTDASVYVLPDFGHKLKKTDAGIVFRLYGRPSITCDDTLVSVQGWTFQTTITLEGDFETNGVTGLPAGLSYSDTTHAISGIPTAAPGDYTVTITAANPAITVTKTITITVSDAVPAPVFTIDPVIARPEGPFGCTITADNLPQSFTVISGLPAWMTLAQDASTLIWTISGTPPQGGGTWTITLEATNPTGATQTTLTVIIADSTAAPVITSGTSVVWVVGLPFNYQIVAENSPAFYNITGTLPAGVTLDAFSGMMGGAPTMAGTSTMTMHAVNSTGAGNAPLSIEVLPGMDQPRLTSSATAVGYLNQNFSYTFTGTPYVTSYNVTSTLPAWLSYDAATATLSGICPGDPLIWSDSGSSWPVAYQISNLTGNDTGTIDVVIKKIFDIPEITNSGTVTAYVDKPFSYRIAVTSTVGIDDYSATGLPAGLTVNHLTGEISGAPATLGTYPVTLEATTSGGTGTKAITMIIVPVPPGPFINSPATADGATGWDFSYQITAETPATTYGATGLPPGLAVDSTTGLISGTPMAAGYYQVEISTTDSNGTFVATVELSLVPDASTIITYAGALDTPGFVDGNGADARFDQPCAAAFSISGTIFVADFANNAIRAIAMNGDVSNYISAAQPAAVAVDSQGNIYFADRQTGAIMKILPLDQTVWPVVGGLSNPGGIAIDASDNIYFTESGSNVVKKISAADGTVSILAGVGGTGGFADGDGASALFKTPEGLAYDQAANTLYIADMRNSMIRAVNLATGVVGTVAGAAEVDGYWDGAAGTARFNTPQGLAVDAAGFIYVADTGNSTIRVCDPKTGFIATLAGLPQQAGSIDGSGATALLNHPTGIIIDTNGTGDVYVIDTDNSAIRALVSPPCIVSPLVSSTIKAGRPITLDGRAWGAPAPSYQWYKDGVAVSGAQGQGSVLGVDLAKASDAGTYQVVAFNASGTAASSMQLTVDASGGSGGGTVTIDGNGDGGGGGVPSTWFLLGIAALALGRRVRRRRFL
jgi:autotransporter-associated beta strand protein